MDTSSRIDICVAEVELNFSAQKMAPLTLVPSIKLRASHLEDIKSTNSQEKSQNISKTNYKRKKKLQALLSLYALNTLFHSSNIFKYRVFLKNCN